MKKVCDMSKEDREFVLRLLHITKDDFERAFQDLAKSDSLNGKRKFVSFWCELAELAFTKAKEEDLAAEIKELYNETFNGILPTWNRLSAFMRSNVEKCIREFGKQSVSLVFDQVKHEKDSLGYNNTGFIADFAYIFKPKNFEGYLSRYNERISKEGGETC